MQPIMITLQARAYEALQGTIDANPELKRREMTVEELMEEHLNNHTEAIVVMLQEQY